MKRECQSKHFYFSMTLESHNRRVLIFPNYELLLKKDGYVDLRAIMRALGIQPKN